MGIMSDGTGINCYVIWQTNMSHGQSCKNTSGSRHAIKTLHNTFPPRSRSAPKPLTATLMQEVTTMHEKFPKVYLPVAPDRVLTYGKSKFALKYSNGKGMPSGFSHCHRVVLSTQKNCSFFQHQRQRATRSGSVKSNR